MPQKRKGIPLKNLYACKIHKSLTETGLLCMIGIIKLHKIDDKGACMEAG